VNEVAERSLDRLLAQQLRLLVEKREWSGTTSELAEMFSHSAFGHARFPARLGRWLRRNEATLWWEHGVRVEFSRTGDERQVHLSRREKLVAKALT
jgi:hypothetical protein